MILFTICLLFINNVSSVIKKKETSDITSITTDLKNAIKTISNNLQDEQRKTSTDTYNGENLEKIESSGSYHYTGEITTIVTIQKDSGTVHLYLENAKFSNPGVKIIDSKKGVNLIITLIGENMISNQDETSSNAISTSQDLTINGPGSLNIVSSKSGIKCDGVFYGFGGSLSIRAQNHGISAESLYLDGIHINVEETNGGKDGLHAEIDYDGVSEVPSFDFLRGFVYFQSGTIKIEKSTGDGIQADSFVYITGGNLNIKTVATWETFQATENRMKGCFRKTGDTYMKVPSDEVRRGSTYYILSNSCKGIKVGEIDYFMKDDADETEQIVESSFYTTLIEGGTIEIDSPDDSIHTNSGSTLIFGGKIKVSTLDDAINADLNLVVNDGEINVLTCFEGLEAQNVQIMGGNIKIAADDDGINAAGGRDSRIVFSGGTTYVYAKGDGIDSNGDLIFNGGEVYVLQTSDWNGALDSDGDILVNGGLLVAAGSSGMPELPSTSSMQNVIVRKIDSTSDDISLKSSSDKKELLSFPISSIFGVKVSYSLVTLSSNLIEKCTSYDIVTGSKENNVITSGSSNVTSNVRSGWGGGGNYDNSNENCPESAENNKSQDSQDNGKKLPTGAIIGIVVGCVVVVALVVALLVYFLVIKKKAKIHSSNEDSSQ